MMPLIKFKLLNELVPLPKQCAQKERGSCAFHSLNILKYFQFSEILITMHSDYNIKKY